jgi:NAD(P)H-dependent FMN reductase
MNLALIYGTASPARRLASALGVFRKEAEADGTEISVVDCAATPLDWAAGRSTEKLSLATQEAIGRISAADAVVLFTPVYRAAAPGVLKNLLDLLPVESLESKPVGLVAMGATLHHYLGVGENLAPVISWFGAIAVPPGVYLTSESFEAGQPGAKAITQLQAYARTVKDLTRRLGGFRAELRPLAAGYSG